MRVSHIHFMTVGILLMALWGVEAGRCLIPARLKTAASGFDKLKRGNYVEVYHDDSWYLGEIASDPVCRKDEQGIFDLLLVIEYVTNDGEIVKMGFRVSRTDNKDYTEFKSLSDDTIIMRLLTPERVMKWKMRASWERGSLLEFFCKGTWTVARIVNVVNPLADAVLSVSYVNNGVFLTTNLRYNNANLRPLTGDMLDYVLCRYTWKVGSWVRIPSMKRHGFVYKTIQGTRVTLQYKGNDGKQGIMTFHRLDPRLQPTSLNKEKRIFYEVLSDSAKKWLKMEAITWDKETITVKYLNQKHQIIRKIVTRGEERIRGPFSSSSERAPAESSLKEGSTRDTVERLDTIMEDAELNG